MATEDLTTQQVENETKMGWLLNAEQRAVCEQVAIGETLNSQRAQALLIVDDGVTQAEAGRQSGLTLYQVKYCLTRFRQLDVAMFPPVTLAATQPDPDLAPESVFEPELSLIVGEAEIMVEKPDNKTVNEAPKGKKSKKKRKKSKKDKGRKKAKKKSKKSKKKKDAGGKKGRKSKSGKKK